MAHGSRPATGGTGNAVSGVEAAAARAQLTLDAERAVIGVEPATDEPDCAGWDGGREAYEAKYYRMAMARGFGTGSRMPTTLIRDWSTFHHTILKTTGHFHRPPVWRLSHTPRLSSLFFRGQCGGNRVARRRAFWLTCTLRAVEAVVFFLSVYSLRPGQPCGRFGGPIVCKRFHSSGHGNMTNRRRFMKLVSTAAVASMAATQTDSTPRSSAESVRTVSRANKTVFGKNVYVFDAAMSAAGIHQIARDIFRKMESNQFASQGYALLFKPGKYRLNFNVGFYTEVAGLGQNPDDVLIDGGVNVNAQWSGGAALDNFWRTISNFALVPSASGGAARFAVSQA